MSSTQAKILDMIALTTDLPAVGLVRGQVGTVVECLAPDVFEVEFVDDAGHTYARATVKVSECIVLRYRPQHAA